MFITFEGLDYSGKTTQAKLLVEHLTKRGKEVVFLREPGGTSISEKIREILLDKMHLELTQIAELFLFSAARTQLVNQIIKPALEKGKIVVCDRYYDSTTAYQGFGRGINLDDVKTLNRIATSGLTPGLTIYVDVAVDELFRRQEAAGVSADRMESAGTIFFEQVRDGYWTLAQEEPGRFVIIDGSRPVEIIQEDVWKLIEKRIVLK